MRNKAVKKGQKEADLSQIGTQQVKHLVRVDLGRNGARPDL